MNKFRLMIATAYVFVATHLSVGAEEIRGAGATLPGLLYSEWGEAYFKWNGDRLNYLWLGSSAGIKLIENRKVTFGGTDAPLMSDEINKYGIAQFPVVMTPIVPVLNVPGIKPGDLVLDGVTLARIFLGEVRRWDDPAIKRLNPDVKLPALAIIIVHRSDGSGTTFNFTNYLAGVDPEFSKRVGSGKWLEWPVSIEANGNQGVAQMVLRTKGSIGYVAYPYVKTTEISYARTINKNGNIVSPTMSGCIAASANVNWHEFSDFRLDLIDRPGPLSWPICAVSYILMQKRPPDPTATQRALSFFDYGYLNGRKIAKMLDYVPIPKAVVSDVELMWQTDFRAPNGELIWQPQVMRK